MRIALLFLLVFGGFCSTAQVIDYSVPTGFKGQLSATEYKKIVDASVTAVSKRFQVDSVQDGVIRLVKLQDMQSFHLHNLIAHCLTLKNRDEWEIAVREHFDKLFATIDAQENFDPEDFKEVKKHLSIRVYPKQFVMQRSNNRSLIVQTNLEGTFTMLMYDMPGGAFTPAQRKNFNHWNRNIDEIFAMAKANVNKQQVQKLSNPVDADGVRIEAVQIHEENYAASYAIDIGNNSPELVGDMGCIVAVPNRGDAYVHKIVKAKPGNVVAYIQKMQPVVEKGFVQHSHPVTNQFFWYYKDKFTRINVTTDASGKVNVTLPTVLTALLSKVK